MSTIINTSTNVSLSALILAQPPALGENLFENPGRYDIPVGTEPKSVNPTGLTGRRYYVFLFFGNEPTPIWAGRLFPDDIINVNADNKNNINVIWEEIGISIDDLIQAKTNGYIDNASDDVLAQLLAHAKTRDPHGNLAVPGDLGVRAIRGEKTDWEPCLESVADLIIDLIAFAFSLNGIYKALKPADKIITRTNLMQRLLGGPNKKLGEVVTIAQTLMESIKDGKGQSLIQIAKLAGKLLLKVKSDVIDVVKNIISGLSTWDMILYGTILCTEMALFIASDGVALALKFVIMFVDVNFLVKDGEQVASTCFGNAAKVPIVDYMNGGTDVGGGFIIGAYSPTRNFVQASAFDVKGGSFNLYKIILGVEYPSGPDNILIINLCADSVEGLPGAVIENLKVPIDEFPVQAFSLTRPVLENGKRYWLTLSIGEQTSHAALDRVGGFPGIITYGENGGPFGALDMVANNEKIAIRMAVIGVAVNK